MRIASIASGSGGNCIYVGSDRYHVLIDAGISLRRVENGLKELGLSVADIDAVLITHEHSDHVSGLGPLLKKHHPAIYASAGTIGELSKMAALSSFGEEAYHYVTAGNRFRVGDLTILPMAISHDAREPLMFRIHCGEVSAAVVTDIGVVTEDLAEQLQDLDVLFLEANHDIRMLEMGPYPYFLKRRIAGNQGHLCNEMAGQLLARVACPRLKTVVLSHISKTNNYTHLATEGVWAELKAERVAHLPRLIIAPETELSEIIEV